MENELSRVVDALPGLVWTALPNGHIDFVNRESTLVRIHRPQPCGSLWLGLAGCDLP